MDLDGNNNIQLTFHRNDGVRFPNISRSGNIITYERKFDIWKYDIASRKYDEIKIVAPSDIKFNICESKKFTNKATDRK